MWAHHVILYVRGRWYPPGGPGANSHGSGGTTTCSNGACVVNPVPDRERNAPYTRKGSASTAQDLAGGYDMKVAPGRVLCPTRPELGTGASWLPARGTESQQTAKFLAV